MNTHGLDRRRFLGLSGATALGALGLSGCGSGDGAGQAEPTSLTTPKTKPDKLVVRTWGDPWASTIKKLVGDPFTKETGIGIEFDLGDFGPTHVKIQQALAGGSRPPVDVVHTVGFFAEKARAQELIAYFDPDVVTNLDQLGPNGLPVSDAVGVPFSNVYGYTFPVIYDADRIDLNNGMSWGDLLTDTYPDSFFAASTFEVLAFPIAKHLGIDAGADPMDGVWDALRDIRPTLAGFGQDPDFATSLRAGQSKMGAFIAGNGIALREGGMNVKWLVPEEGTSMTGDSLYVPGGLPDDVTYWSQVFVNGWLEASTQTEFCKIMGVIPVNSQSTLAEERVGDPAFPFTEEEIEQYAIPVPLEVTARNQDDWQGKYVAALQG